MNEATQPLCHDDRSQRCLVTKRENTLRIKCQQQPDIKGEDIQQGTFYHLEAAVEEVQLSLWM